MKRIFLILFTVLVFNLLYIEGNSAISATSGNSVLISEAADIEQPQANTAEVKEGEKAKNNDASDSNQELEEILEGENNPITNQGGEKTDTVNEAANNSINKKETEPAQNSKEEKPKYGKYKNVDNDPYIQKWENELKNIDNGSTAQEADTEKKEEKEEQKTYTQDDYEQAYRDMQVPTFSYIHGIDPDQYYDMKDTTWSPYPLLRLNSPLYFKTVTIQPGYYLLTPRKYKEDWFILFKEAGTVKYTIPVFEKSYTPESYYRDNLKEADMSRSARWQIRFLNAWGKFIRKSKRRPATKCNIELTDLDNNFLLLDLYYGAHKYSTIFRIEKF